MSHSHALRPVCVCVCACMRAFLLKTSIRVADDDVLYTILKNNNILVGPGIDDINDR